MSPNRLTDKYQPHRLEPTVYEGHAKLVVHTQRLCPSGSIYHLLDWIPEQSEKMYWILVDDHSVVKFEIPYEGPGLPEEVQVGTLREYRYHIGQGKRRIRLDRAVEDARQLSGAA